MKKVVYIQPQLKTCKIDTETILAGGSVTGDNGLGYGGVDEEGTQVPDANNFDVWSDDDKPKKHNDLFED
ncbi:MAG: hypothetical protein IKX36_02490 [Prevotella sp.]|nr:hypothetical protein [Prevotella sp.]